jgi:hypothetical protein
MELGLERCEDRFLLSTFLVKNTLDDINASNSLPWAINQVNQDTGNPGVDTIDFSIPTPGPYVITVTTLLPTIIHPVLIDGTSQNPANPVPTVTISENSGSGVIDGLVLGTGSDGSTIQGLSIVNFGAAAIHLQSSGDTVASNYLGVGVTPVGTNGANRVGVLVDNAVQATIGGTTTGAANVIGFNTTAGVQIVGTSTTDATNALVEGNLIGTDATGTQDWGNSTAVQIFNAAGNTIGGTTAGASSPAANVIGFNTSAGIAVLSGTGNAINANTYDGSNGSLQTPSVAANDIGLGIGANGNLQPPQLLSASLSSNGGTLGLALTGNVSTTTVLDVYLYSMGQRAFLGETTIASGSFSGSLPVSVVTTSSQVVATQSVSGDGTSAFSAPLSVAAQSTVTNTNSSGPGSLFDAISAAESGGTKDITFQIPGTGPFTIAPTATLAITVPLTIDGTSELTSQKTPAIVLSSAGGAKSGLDLSSNSDGSTIEGLQFTGFTGPAILVETTHNTIGGTAAGAGNVVSTAGSAGVSITGASNVIEGNFIGTDAAGDDLGNGQGVILDDVGSNTIGGTTAGSGNVIAFSSSAGVSISGSSASLNVLEGNLIGTNAAGANLGNGLGVVIDGASNNSVGGTATGAGNTIAFNGSAPSFGALTVNAGTGDTILNNLFYGNTGPTIATSGIDLTNGGNDVADLPAPVISGVASSGSVATSITLNVTGMAAGTYVLDVFASAPGDTPNSDQVDAHVMLQTFQNVSITPGLTSLTETIAKALNGGQQVTATWTVAGTAPPNLTTGDTSEFAATAAVPQPFVVTTTAPSGAGSLAFEIDAINADTSNSNPDTIQFQLLPGDPNYNSTTRVWTITPDSSLTISHPVILDATLQSGYAGTPVIEIDGQLVAGGGLILANTANGSTIRGLDIVNFGGAGLDIEGDSETVQSNDLGVLSDGVTAAPNAQGMLINGSNSTIGGTAAGAGNVIADNIGAAVNAANGSVNTIRGNLIFGNGSSIVTSGSESPPTLTAAISSGGTTTIEGSVAPSTPTGTILDFYANSGTQAPAAIYLGSYVVSSSSAGFPNFTASLSVSVPTGANITATATSPAGDTSELSSPIAAVNPLAVTNVNDSGVGSLRQALDSANQNGGLATIVFNLPAHTTSTIDLDSPLPTIMNPVVIDATGLESASGVPVVVIDGQRLSGDGLILGTNSGNSTIKGLDIINFAGIGIDIVSSGNIVQDNYVGITGDGTPAANDVGIEISGSSNTIGGATSLPGNSLGGTASLNGAANVIAFNTGAAVAVTTGTVEVIRQNLIFGNGSGISNGSGPAAPAIIAVSSVPNLTTIDYTVNGSPGQTYAVDFYSSNASGGPAGLFLGSTSVTLAANSQNFSIAFTPATALTGTQTVTATVTDPTAGTSSFALTTASPTNAPFKVTNSSDNLPGSEVGSLRQAILNANDSPPGSGTDPITFAAGGAPYVINPTTALPAIAVPVSILGTAGAPAVEIDGGGRAFDGLVLGPGSNGSVVQGLDIADFLGAGIHVESSDASILGNFLGTDPAGTIAGPGDVVGVLIDNVAGVTVGGTVAADSNTIDFNTSAGVSITGALATGNAVEGNAILSNAVGVAISAQASSNTIGGTIAGSPNTIGSNTTEGIAILSGTGNAVRENLYQGTNGTVTTPSVAAGDIAVALNANGNLAAPVLYSAAQAQTGIGEYTLSVLFAGVLPAGSNQPITIDVYEFSETARTFLGTADWDGTAPESVTIDLQTPLVANTDQIVATATVSGDGTSPFSAPFTVTSAGTVSNTQDSGPGSLRFELANATPDTRIQFNIPASDPNYSDATGNFTIRLLTPLTISTQVFIDGTTEAIDEHLPGAVIQITDGTGSLPYGINLMTGSDGSTIEGLDIEGFHAGAGILIGSTDNTIDDNWIGTDAAGDNLGDDEGVVIDAAGNTIGGTAAGAGNTIGYNSAAGVSISGASATDNLVEGNDIGTNGAASNLGNGVGVVLSDDPGNTIGGTTLGAANIFGFNANAGVSLSGSTGDLVWGNYIGTDAFNDKMGNGVGIEIDGSSDNSIGGTVGGTIDPTQVFPAWFTESLTYSGTDAQGGSISGTAGTVSGIGNIIDFNQGAGISMNGIASSGSIIGSTSTGNVEMGNLIGLNVVYQRESNNQKSSTQIENAGNLGDGIVLDGSNGVQSNSIGFADALSYIPTMIGGTITAELTLVDALGTGPLQTFPQQAVGAGQGLSGTVAVGNIITANRGDGVSITDSASLNVVMANTIGATSSFSAGTTSSLVGNSGNGISITNSASNNTIGDDSYAPDSIMPLDGGANVVSGNADDGILVNAGTLSAGIPNIVAGNLVSFNTQNGIHFVGDLSAGSTQVQIINNLVGTNFSGDSTVDPNGIPQGNGLDGIRLEQSAQAVTPGSPSAVVANNVSSGNGLSGINIQTSGGISYASVSIFGNHVGTDISGSLVSASSRGVVVPFGNALDGILLNEVVGVVVGLPGQGNIASGNLGRGIEVRGDKLNLPFYINTNVSNIIQDNLIGLGGLGTTVVDATGTDLGNLSDGIFLLDPGRQFSEGDQTLATSDVIQGNTVSNNQGAGIHAVFGAGLAYAPDGLMIADNRIGTDPTGTVVEVPASANSALLESLGNASDGVFLDSVPMTDGTTALVTIEGNLISGNHANGIDLLQSNQVLIAGNRIGTNIDDSSTIGNPAKDFGNAANGVFLNQSDQITIGGTTQGALNIISGNHTSGVFVSGTTVANNGGTITGSASDSNLVEGNWIGVAFNAGSQPAAIPNAVAGIVLSNADSNTIGGSDPGAANVISGNSLDGILLVNDANDNAILDNLIGTNPSDTGPIGNSADGIFLLGSSAIPINGVTSNTTPSTISGNTIDSNVIAGNNQDGIQVFGTGATDNAFTHNAIGLSPGGTRIPNGSDGVLLNDAGPSNVVGGIGQGNVISGNNQAGIEIANSPDATSGTEVEGNLIGTDSSGRDPVGNGSYGVLVYGSSANTIGGATSAPGSGPGNVISGNSQAGILIVNPGGVQTYARYNMVLGNLVGTNAAGTAGLGNGSDGIEIENASDNQIGGASAADRNVISRNAGNGVLIVQYPNLFAADNQVSGNEIGTDATGTAGLGNLGSGVELIDGSANTIGGISGGATLPNTQVPAGGGPGNLISGNSQWGVLIQITGASAGQPQSAIQGNIIGLDASESFAIGNGLGGIFVDNVTTLPLGQTIGGSAAGAGNIITGNANVGIQLGGGSGANDIVQGNLIGLNAAGQVINLVGGVTGNGTGILASNSPDDLIGGTSPADRNVISGNDQSGVELFNVLSTGDLVLGNFIGTDPTGNDFPAGSTEANPLQSVGVLIVGASGDTVGQAASGAGNLISGNAVGVEISGVKQTNGQVFGSGNVVAGNRIGTDASGTRPVSNLDLGVFVNNSQGNVIGPGNVISANGIAGVEILADGSQQNLVAGNNIGEGINGEIFSSRGRSVLSSNGPEPGIPVFADAQLNGVVLLGASGNTVGLDTRIPGSGGNTISGNVQVGAYITSRDFEGKVYTVPINDSVSGNIIRSNGIYGVLLYDAPNNPVRPFTSPSRFLAKNTFGGQKTSFRNYQAAFDAGTSLRTRELKSKHPAKAAHVVHPAKVEHGEVRANSTHHASPAQVVHRARPRIPALFESRAKPERDR